MPVIRVKRGTATPTTINVSNIGELAFDYNSDALFIRGSSSMVRVGAMEQIKFYEGNTDNYHFEHEYDRNYIYKFHIVCSTSAKDTSSSYIKYYEQNELCAGALATMYLKDSSSSISVLTGRSKDMFYLYDSYSTSVDPSYATTKVIDFEMSPTQETSANASYAWVVQGKSTCCSSDQSDTPITFSIFSHAVDARLTGVEIYSGLNSGATDTFTLSVYRMRRR
jgi:hypothetical protein